MGSVIQLKNKINNSYFLLKNSVEDKLMLVEEKIKSKLESNVDLVQKMTRYHLGDTLSFSELSRHCSLI